MDQPIGFRPLVVIDKGNRLPCSSGQRGVASMRYAAARLRHIVNAHRVVGRKLLYHRASGLLGIIVRYNERERELIARFKSSQLTEELSEHLRPFVRTYTD